MTGALSTILTIFFVMPFLGFILVFYIARLVTKNTRKSVHKALDYSTLLFIISVHFLLATIWGKSFFWLILLVMIIIAMGFVLIHWKVKQEIIIRKVLKGYWRFNFIVFFIAYMLLSLYGLLHRAIMFTFTS